METGIWVITIEVIDYLDKSSLGKKLEIKNLNEFRDNEDKEVQPTKTNTLKDISSSL